ncbi:nuclear transport factor 2 family protein [Acidipila sp. EB88]|nr:nuclear transport factor 2 family protein [Acidipila sp. EB88]
MRHALLAILGAALAFCVASPATLLAQAQAPSSGPAAGQIQAMLQKQAADWNRGDLDAFATGYKNSPDILFIGKDVRIGYAAMLARYRQAYGTRAKMGALTFTALAVQPLDARFATTTGHFHLERTAEGGGNADGYFLLVLEHTGTGWKIVRDDTTALPAVIK